MFLLWFPFWRGEAGLFVTPLYGYVCNLFPLDPVVAFYLLFCSSSAFLGSLFTQSSHLRCGLPRFLSPSCFFVSDLFGNLSSFILTMYPSHFIRFLTIFQLYKPYFYIILFDISYSVSPFSLHRLLPLSSCSRIQYFMLLPSGQSNRLQSILAGTTQHYMTLLFSFLEIFISSITPSTFLHAIAPACILRRTSTCTCTLVQWLGLSRITRPARVQSPGWEARILGVKTWLSTLEIVSLWVFRMRL